LISGDRRIIGHSERKHPLAKKNMEQTSILLYGQDFTYASGNRDVSMLYPLP